MLTEWKAAAMRHTPDSADLLESGKHAMGPSAGAALVVFALGLLIFGKKSAVLSGALAMIAGFVAANYFRHMFDPWWPDRRANGGYIGSDWLPGLYGATLLTGASISGQGMPKWGIWWLRIGMGLLAALILVPPDLHDTWPLLINRPPFAFQSKYWPLAAFAMAVALGWAGSAGASQKSPGGAIGLALAMALFGASFVVVHAHFAKFADVLSVGGAALTAISIVAAFARVEVTGAAAGVALLIPGALLVAATETYSEVPWTAFVLAGLPPITMVLLAIPAFSRLAGWWKWVIYAILVLGPTIAAVALAASAESLPVAEEWSMAPSRVPC
jgi:hypothetical protein